ncbi:sensor histidine kinase [uncultured Fibrella sp.]|uniref:sensor histidine kinase n=1 Tax=uncultured Fibrella sp. TaxID=1284596 RepID=UPI0035CBE610
MNLWSERAISWLNGLAVSLTTLIVVLDYFLNENFFEQTWLQAFFFVFPVSSVFINNFVLVPHFFDRGRYRAYGLTLFVTVLGTLLLSRWFADPAYFNRYWLVWLLDFVRFFISVLAAFGFVAFGRLVVHQNQQMQQQYLLQQSELTNLKAQINPHFLFNTLNNIYFLCLERSDKAAGMVAQLSGLMRYNLEAGRKDRVPLDEEFTSLEHYVRLEQTRLPPGGHVELHREGPFGGVYLAPFLLMPFVENCFKHGADRNALNPQILLRVEVAGPKLFFYAENNKPASVSTDRQARSGTGLANVRQRLRLLYPARHELTLTETDTQYVVSLMIDLP